MTWSYFLEKVLMQIICIPMLIEEYQTIFATIGFEKSKTQNAIIFDRIGVAGAVLHTASLLIHSLIQSAFSSSGGL